MEPAAAAAVTNCRWSFHSISSLLSFLPERKGKHVIIVSTTVKHDHESRFVSLNKNRTECEWDRDRQTIGETGAADGVACGGGDFAPDVLMWSSCMMFVCFRSTGCPVPDSLFLVKHKIQSSFHSSIWNNVMSAKRRLFPAELVNWSFRHVWELVLLNYWIFEHCNCMTWESKQGDDNQRWISNVTLLSETGLLLPYPWCQRTGTNWCIWCNVFLLSVLSSRWQC